MGRCARAWLLFAIEFRWRSHQARAALQLAQAPRVARVDPQVHSEEFARSRRSLPAQEQCEQWRRLFLCQRLLKIEPDLQPRTQRPIEHAPSRHHR